jgi:hypothetical protein
MGRLFFLPATSAASALVLPVSLYFPRAEMGIACRGITRNGGCEENFVSRKRLSNLDGHGELEFRYCEEVVII